VTTPASAPDVLMPAAFIGHGSPMNALELNQYTRAWRDFGAAVPRPRAILVVSAHWYIETSAVTAMARPRTIHDFSGFPHELFAVRYPALGDADLAAQVVELVKPFRVELDPESWGIDHGAWSVLVHAFPEADIPVVQLAINAREPLEYHLDLAAQLAPLRRQGVLILGSGNVVHNLHRLDRSLPDEGFDWAQRFDAAAREAMTTTPAAVLALRNHRDFTQAVPTPDHFIPLVYLAGLATAASAATEVLIDGFTLGSLSMTCYGLAT
jgi:4,5-DOPA dioxygenase extradiol